MRLIPISWAPSGVAVRLNYIGCNLSDKPTDRPLVPFFQPPTGAFITPPTPSAGQESGTTPSASQGTTTSPASGGTTDVTSTAVPPTPFFVVPGQWSSAGRLM